VTFNADLLLRRLHDLQGGAAAGRYLVGFSGGLDSTVLLHALRQLAARTMPTVPVVPVVAVHINHALHPHAAAWQEHCREVAEKLEVDFVARELVVDEHGAGLEAAARDARYAALKELIQDGDVLLSAHHEEDQAETLLLNLLRGSGLAGLAAIGACQPFGRGRLIRPMLGVSRHAIERYAREHSLLWVEDPSNLDLRFDRNYLRQEVLPRLKQRWPAVAARLSHTAELAGQAARLQDDLAAIDLSSLLDPPGDAAAGTPDRLDILELSKLSGPRQRNVLRYAIKACGLPQAPASRLRQVQDELLPAREDAQPLVRWRGGEVRRYRRKLYLLPESVAEGRIERAEPPLLYGDGSQVAIGAAPGMLRLEKVAAGETGIDPAVTAGGLQLRFRAGGEKIRPYGRRDSRPLKKLLQERGVLPWMRQNVPLLYAGETLVAVADLWIAQDCARDGGFRVRWDGKPSLFQAE
jgi:tRNA(Ile)-lysidine synthase